MVSCLLWVLETELRYYAVSVCTLKHWAISPACFQFICLFSKTVLPMYPRLAWNLESSFLNLLSVEIIVLPHHCWLHCCPFLDILHYFVIPCICISCSPHLNILKLWTFVVDLWDRLTYLSLNSNCSIGRNDFALIDLPISQCCDYRHVPQCLALAHLLKALNC